MIPTPAIPVPAPAPAPGFNFAALRTELEQTRRLTIHRRIIPSESTTSTSTPTNQFSHLSSASSAASAQPIFGAVTSQDVESALRSANPKLDLKLTEAGASVQIHLSGSERAAKGSRVKSTGEFVADVVMRDGSKVAIKFLVVPLALGASSTMGNVGAGGPSPGSRTVSEATVNTPV